MNQTSTFSFAMAASLVALVYACSDDSTTDGNVGGNAGTSTGGRTQGGQSATTGGTTIRSAAAGNTTRGGNGGSSTLAVAGTSTTSGGTFAGAGTTAVLAGGSAAGGSANGSTAGQLNLSGAAGEVAHNGGTSATGGAKSSVAGQSNSGGAGGSAAAGAKATVAGAAGNIFVSAAGSSATQAGAAGSSNGAGASNAGAAGNSFQEDPRCASASPTATLTAHLRITADNECDVYVNGQSVGQTTNWGSAVTIDVSLYVHPGKKNVVAVVGRNTSSQGGNDRGIIGELTTTVGATTTPLLVTDGQWHVAHALESNWTELTFDDSSWLAATEIASNGDGPWGNVLGTGSLAKWIWFAPVPNDTADKPNAEATYTRRVFYFDFAGQLISSPLCYAP